METMHKEVLKTANDDGLNSLVTHTSDYFQVEITYLRNDKDLLIIVSFPIPLPLKTLERDLTIGQAIQIRDFQNFSEPQLDHIFDMNKYLKHFSFRTTQIS